MADDPHNTSDISDPVEGVSAKEDAETTAARRELKQTSISEKVGGQDSTRQLAQEDQSGSDNDDNTAQGGAAAVERTTPDTDVGDSKEDLLREQVASPKKKRAHDELVADGSSTAGEGSRKPASIAVTQTRTEESEPEKKRPRDRESSRRRSQDGEESSGSSRSSLDKGSDAKKTLDISGGASGDKPAVASKSAFASSGFARLAASTSSPFANAASGKGSVFGGASVSSGSFGALGGSKPATSTAPKLTFGGSLSGPSPFALNGGKGAPSVFGSPFASAFGGSALSGSRLSTFGKPGEALKSDKPAKPFGAPDSDAEDGSDNGNDAGDDKEEDARSDNDEAKETGKDKDEPKSLADDKKKIRLQKIKVDDGESGEVTLLAVRAKLYVLEKGDGPDAAAWKERGAGMLKVNVPSSSIELDDLGNPDPSTFDASTLEEHDDDDDDDDDDDTPASPRCVRLIMRQDHTLRVILNTVILPAMNFKVTRGLKSALVLFTAFDEHGEAIPMQVKMSDANTTLFTELTQMIQRQLADV